VAQYLPQIIATETDGQMPLLCVTLCACAREAAKERGTYAATQKYYQNNFSVNKQNRDVKPANEEGLLYSQNDCVLCYLITLFQLNMLHSVENERRS
jgi:hypothetical protein